MFITLAGSYEVHVCTGQIMHAFPHGVTKVDLMWEQSHIICKKKSWTRIFDYVDTCGQTALHVGK